MEKCLVCNSREIACIYKDRIRSGAYGKVSDEEYSVMRCANCNLAYLQPFPKIPYDTSQYREAYNDASDISSYFLIHDRDQMSTISKIGIERFRGKVVVDIGCGGGSFLDAVKGLATKTIGIEPFVGYHSSLLARGHEVFSSLKEAEKQLSESVEIVVSFGVIEHTVDPIEYMRGAYSLLNKGGVIYLETDNTDDFLMNMKIPEYEQFFYRTAHNWYFDRKSLRRIFEELGFENIKEGFLALHDLSNVFLWMKDRVPTGVGAINDISLFCDNAWKLYLEESGRAEILHFSAEK